MSVCLNSELTLGPHTGIPWKSGLKRGSALEADGDSILVSEEGFYFVYSQVGSLSVAPGFCRMGVLSTRPIQDQSEKDALSLYLGKMS